jgi:hypothetical protein
MFKATSELWFIRRIQSSDYPGYRNTLSFIVAFWSILVGAVTIPASPYWEAGMISGWIMPHRDFGYYWRPSLGTGFSVTCPFHPRLPVSFSLLASNHLPKLPAKPVRTNYLTPRSKVALFDFKLTAAYRLLQKRAISPVGLFGVNCDMFIDYTDRLNMPEYMGETELGIHAGAGIEKIAGDRYRIRIAYIEDFVFARPHIIPVGIVYLELSMFYRSLRKSVSS